MAVFLYLIKCFLINQHILDLKEALYFSPWEERENQLHKMPKEKQEQLKHTRFFFPYFQEELRKCMLRMGM